MPYGTDKLRFLYNGELEQLNKLNQLFLHFSASQYTQMSFLTEYKFIKTGFGKVQ